MVKLRHRFPSLRPVPGGRRDRKGRLLVGLGLVVLALVSFFASREYNPVTDETRYLSLTPKQEIALGLQAAPEVIERYGGLYPDPEMQAYIDAVGQKLVVRAASISPEMRTALGKWQFRFHLLADPDRLNAFALPGGQIFITAGLYSHLESEGQLAAVLAHEVGHVVARHAARRLAKAKLSRGLSDAVVVASGDADAAQVAAVLAELVNLKYSRAEELEADRLAVRFLAAAGYDPRALVQVMEVLATVRTGEEPAEFFSTHPDPESRIAEIQAAIAELYPAGVPVGLRP